MSQTQEKGKVLFNEFERNKKEKIHCVEKLVDFLAELVYKTGEKVISYKESAEVFSLFIKFDIPDNIQDVIIEGATLDMSKRPKIILAELKKKLEKIKQDWYIIQNLDRHIANI